MNRTTATYRQHKIVRPWLGSNLQCISQHATESPQIGPPWHKPLLPRAAHMKHDRNLVFKLRRDHKIIPKSAMSINRKTTGASLKIQRKKKQFEQL